MPRLRLHPAAAVLGLTFLLSACTERFQSPTGPAPSAPPAEPQFAVSGYSGQIVINEVMADPAAVADTDGEWFEVHNWSASAVNLQGWTIAGNNDSPHTISSSVSVPPLGYVVLARNGSSGSNGGVTAAYAYGSMTMANSSDWIALRDGNGASVDSVAWANAQMSPRTSSAPPPVRATGARISVHGEGKAGTCTGGRVRNGRLAPRLRGAAYAE